jgi:DNA-binding response OmpR family regulator
MKILIVEDDTQFGERLKGRLEVAGHEVTTTSCYREACNTFVKKRFDLIITDNNMPIFSTERPERNIGIEVIAEAYRFRVKSKIWFMTSEPSEELFKKASDAGALRTVSKDDLFRELAKAKIIKS